MPQKGFTLIELLIVVIIVAILAAIAVPGYKGMVIRAARSEAKTVLLDIISLEEQYYAENNNYVTGNSTSALRTALNGFNPGLDSDLKYDYSVTVNGTNFNATATPKAGTVVWGDANFYINQDYVKNTSDPANVTWE